MIPDMYHTALLAVILPEGVEEIAWFAFYQCTSLHDVTVPSSVTLIGHAVFDGCANVTLICKDGSYAIAYAESYAIPYIVKE